MKKGFIDLSSQGIVLDENFNISYPFINLNGVSYYLKLTTNESTILREVIGTIISKEMDLKTVDYLPCFVKLKNGKNMEYGTISRNFLLDYPNSTIACKMVPPYKEDSDFLSYCYLSKIDHCFQKDCFSHSIVKLIEELLNMAIRDYVVNEVDRHLNNFSFYLDNDGYRLGPLYDYEYSLNTLSTNDNINNNYFWVNYDILKETIKKYPFVISFIKKAIHINIKRIIEDTQNKYDINLGDEEKDTIYEVVDNKQYTLRKLLN